MCPTIRIDNEVYSWLQAHAVPFNDTPNSVLRRLAGIDKAEQQAPSMAPPIISASPPSSGRRLPAASGDELREKWKIPASQARFHQDSTFYEHLTRFPAALCDRAGYVVFETELEYRSCPQLRIGEKINVPNGISSIPGYVKVDQPIF